MKKTILDIPIDDLYEQRVVKKIDEFINSRKPRHIATVNPEFLVAAARNREFRKILQRTDLNIPDGAGLKIAGIKNRVTGTDLVEKLAQNGYHFYLIGGQSGVAKKAGEHLAQNGAKIVGAIAGEYSDEPSLTQQEIKTIHSANADILLVAFGQIKQERFIARYLQKLNIPVAIGVGGAFDYFAGTVPRAPSWLRTLGLEWLFRLIVQPTRLARIYTAVVKFTLLYWFSK